jgi:hypothetical protein
MSKTLILCVLLSQPLSAIACNPATEQEQHRGLTQAPARGEPRSGKSAPQESGHRRRTWRAATFRGLTVGKSTRAGMLRIFGKPKWSGVAAGQVETDPKPVIWNEYEGVGDFPGKFTVEVDKSSDVIVGMFLSPENLSKDEAIKRFGDDSITTRYEFDSCLSKCDEEGAPLYESLKGQFMYIEYRMRGIALSVDEMGKVKEIRYMNENELIGTTESKCKKIDKTP